MLSRPAGSVRKVRACSGTGCVTFDAVTAVALTASGHSPIIGSGTALNSEDICCDVESVDKLFFFAQQL